MIQKLAIIFLALFYLASCVDNQGVRSTRQLNLKSKVSSAGDTKSGNSGGSNAAPNYEAPGDGTFTGTTDQNLALSRVELRHLVDPFDGTYKTKVTIPKNFEGILYISGLNVTSLSDRLVTVRFRFGRELEKIDIPAVIGRAPGITPQTDIEVLQLDFSNRPFENLRLLYDLYDYNDYRNSTTGVEDFFDSNGQLTLPTQDPRNSSLYCRGLKLEHDPTFISSATNTLCDSANEKCLYAYAKILDSGLIDPNNGNNAIIPTLPQIDFSKLGYVKDTEANNLLKCLPDSNILSNLSSVLNANGIGANGALVSINDVITMPSGKTYVYQGPFRTVGESTWNISSNALFSEVNLTNGPSGLFQKTYTAGMATHGYQSFLFPRAGKLDLRSGVEYFGSTSPMGPRNLTKLITSGKSEYMNGCNIRVSTYDNVSSEGISSCNITASIELITTDTLTGKEVSLLKVPETGIKLQVIRSSLTNYKGEEVLYTSLKYCKNNNGCGSNECCFNERCWGKELVSQCLEDSPNVGQGAVGEVCSTDLDCSSLCCNSTTGKCAVHQTIGTDPVLCGKSSGQSCLTREFCKIENIPTCYIVKTGIGPTGQQECAKRCYNTPTFGTCRGGICIPPSLPSDPAFDPTSPNCAGAIDPPLTTNSGSSILPP